MLPASAPERLLGNVDTLYFGRTHSIEQYKASQPEIVNERGTLPNMCSQVVVNDTLSPGIDFA